MRVKNITQRFEGFVQNLQESFGGDFQGQTRQRLKEVLEKDAQQQMAEYLGLQWHEPASEQEPRIDSRNGFYQRNYVTALGVIQLRIPRTRLRSFLPRCIAPLERRSPEVAELIRQAFLRGISTRQVGRVVAVVTGEAVSAQTVSQLTRVLDQAVEAFHHRALGDDWAYLFLDGVWLKVRRATGPQRVLLLVAYGVRRNGTRELLAFTRAKAESQAGWEGLLNDLFRRGLCGKNLQLVITDGCPGLARAIETETSQGYFRLLQSLLRRYGVPVAFYGDRSGVFTRNDDHWSLDEQLAGHRQPTQFGRALQQLGVTFIAAQTPQAKGRIERLWGVLQDRLSSELRMAQACDLDSANRVLARFVADYNRRFARTPRDAANA
jgi:hypothetical protein